MKQIEAEESELQKCTTEQLKAELRENAQSQTGDKGVLMEKVAEGRVLGALPKCPACKIGFLTFRRSDGAAFCKGYYNAELGRPRCQTRLC